MRSDLIAAGMIQNWLQGNAPHLLHRWTFALPDEAQGFVSRILSGFPALDAQFVGQGAIAATAIALWQLEGSALFGSGIPTPLSPAPAQVKYYTDANPRVVEAAREQGYPAQCVDVTNRNDLERVSDATAAIATGLMHFFDDEALSAVLTNFAQAGFQTLVFNNMNEQVAEELLQNWGRMGHTLYPRTMQQIEALLPAAWRLADSLTTAEFFKHHRDFVAPLEKLPNINNIYRIIGA